jgi:hypothetical protein
MYHELEVYKGIDSGRADRYMVSPTKQSKEKKKVRQKNKLQYERRR